MGGLVWGTSCSPCLGPLVPCVVPGPACTTWVAPALRPDAWGWSGSAHCTQSRGTACMWLLARLALCWFWCGFGASLQGQSSGVLHKRMLWAKGGQLFGQEGHVTSFGELLQAMHMCMQTLMWAHARAPCCSFCSSFPALSPWYVSRSGRSCNSCTHVA